MNDIKQEIIRNSKEFVKVNKRFVIDPKEKGSTSYLSPRLSSEYMDCSLPMTFDSYSHCSLSCCYCFAYMQKSNNPTFSGKLHTVNVDNIVSTIHGKPKGSRKHFYKHFIEKRFVFHWGGLADPFCNFEKANHVGYKIIQALAEESYPTLFSFKGSAIFKPNFVKLFEKYAKQKNFAFQVSIIAPSDEISREIEIGVPVTSKRIRAIKMLSDMGYYTILRLRPFIIGVTDEGLDDLLYKCKEAGIKAISTEFVAIDMRGTEALVKRYRWIGELMGIGQKEKDVKDYFRALSPNERGGYLRLNRLVKERFVKQIYKFCLKNDVLFACSDPDYKELNMTGSCCGLPHNFKDNREMQNWTKNQLTFHMKEARQLYHREGKIYKFRFDKVFKPEVDTYLKSIEFGGDHLRIVGMPHSESSTFTYLRGARDTWNNLRSPANPRNYFHGKVMPIRVDTVGNLIYVYTPSEYEDRWKEEGIDLTK